jgi:hypothetical protein
MAAGAYGWLQYRVLWADYLENVRSSTFYPYGLSCPVTGIALPFHFSHVIREDIEPMICLLYV